MAVKVDELDRRIIALLQQDGRMSNVDIAREVGVTEATIRKRMDKLLSQGTIQVIGIPNHAKVGYPIETIILLQVDLLRYNQVAQALAEKPAVRSVKLTTGEYDIVFEAVFAEEQEIFRFLTDEIASIPGVRKTATSHVLRQVKSAYQWTLPGARMPQVLVVDDDPDFVEVIRSVLRTEGYEVLSASSGDEALRLMRVAKPDLVVLDVMMRGVLDGVKASQEMRQDKALSRVPILMVSSIADSDYAGVFPTDEYLSVDNFLSKPIDPSKLIREVERLLGT